MPLSIIIAWRNIFRHRGKSFVIGVILFLGAVLMTVGNGIITGLNKGLQDNIVHSFTGDLVVLSDRQVKNTVIIPMGGLEMVAPINNYLAIRSVLRRIPEVIRFTPAAQGVAMVLNEDGDPDGNYLIGVNFDDYQKMFPGNMKAIEGHLPKQGERGLLLTKVNRKMNYDYLLNYWVLPEGCRLITSNLHPEALENYNLGRLKIRSDMVFMGMNDKTSAMDIRPKTLGVISYRALNPLLGLINLIDIETFRECFGYQTAADTQLTLNAQTQTLLALDDSSLETLFSSEMIAGAKPSSKQMYSKIAIKQLMNKTDIHVATQDIDAGTYNQIYIRLKPGISLSQGLSILNKELRPVHARAITWKQALGEMADMAMIIKAALFVFVMFIFLVAIIIIMNTLSMAALERVTEIGMIRAIGAKKNFITAMFFWETTLLSIFFGGVGMGVGLLIVKLLSLLHLTTENEMLQLLYGGEVFHPFLTLGDMGLCVLQLGIVSLIAMIYPIHLARRITPLEAIARD